MKLKVDWRLQEGGDVRNMSHLLREATGSEQSQPEKEATYLQPARPQEQGCLSSMELTSPHNLP